MPYINSKDGRREKLQGGDIALTAGELNYQIFYYVKHLKFDRLLPTACVDLGFDKIKSFVDNFLGGSPNYQKYNDMTGCLVRCSKEIKRRLLKNQISIIALKYILDYYDDEIAKYEDKKIIENGDV